MTRPRRDGAPARRAAGRAGERGGRPGAQAGRSAERRGRGGAPAGRAGAHRSDFTHRGTAAHKTIGGGQVEGRRAVIELLATGRRQVNEVLVAEGLESSPQLTEIERLAAARHVRLETVPKRRFDTLAVTGSAQGVIARAAEIRDVAFDELLEPLRGSPPFVLFLDGIGDPQNLGALLRSAECAGTTGVVLPRHRAAHVTATVAKVAAGAIEHLRISIVPGVPAALLRAADLGLRSVGLDAGADRSLFDLADELEGPLAIVLGAEGRGLGALTKKRCDVLARIPQRGSMASLNVAAAGAVALFEAARRRAAHEARGVS